MTERFAIYYAPPKGSALDARAEAWLAQEDLLPQTVSARRYGFHATIKAPMALAAGHDRAALEMALAGYAKVTTPLDIGPLAVTPIDGFLALTATPQPPGLTDFAARAVEAFEPFRAPLEPADRARRLKAPLSERQIALLEQYGYPYVLEQFQFHMTLTDRLPEAEVGATQARAAEWFAPVLEAPVVLDRLVLFHEPEPGSAFRRLDDYRLEGGTR